MTGGEALVASLIDKGGETIFGLPGVGRYLLDAIGRLDYPVIQATNLVFGLTLVLSNLVVDLSYAWIDPRVKLR